MIQGLKSVPGNRCLAPSSAIIRSLPPAYCIPQVSGRRSIKRRRCMKYNKTKVASVVHIRYWPMGPGVENARGLTNNAKRNYLAVLHSSLA